MCQCSLRDYVLFFAGAQFFHTLSHIIMPYFISLPLNMGFMTVTPMINLIAIGVNAVITIALLYWAKTIRK
jgi:hypothetical protein